MVFPCPLRRPADGMTQRAGPHADLEIAQIHSAGSISAIKSELACRLPVSPGSRAKVLQACRKDTDQRLNRGGKETRQLPLPAPSPK